MKTEFIKAIEDCGIKDYKLRYFAKGKYNEPEAWLYPKDNPKQQQMNSRGNYLVYPNGEPVMESVSGILITMETLKNKKYLKDYLDNCF